MTHRDIFWFPVIALLFFAGCPSLTGSGSSSSGEDKVTHRERDVSGKLAVALGGNASGVDEIIVDQEFTTLDLENNDPDLLDLEARDGFETFTDGKGGKIIPLVEGIGYVTPIVNARPWDPIEVTIPPQRLIQILLGEARGELAREATTEEDDSQVKETSVSVTGDAVGAVIRNRIDLINENDRPGLFVVDEERYEENPPISYYEAVIEATDGFIYQFSPVDPEDLSHEVYEDAANRSDLTIGEQLAYDQAVLTAASIFNGDTEDPTGGAFAFYSPTEAQYELLQSALTSRTEALPTGCGASDANFPALAPVQVVILEEVAPALVGEEVPSFVFVRSKTSFEPAVVLE